MTQCYPDEGLVDEEFEDDDVSKKSEDSEPEEAPPVRPNGVVRIQWLSEEVGVGELYQLFGGLDELEVLRVVKAGDERDE